ncbi:MAG: hypothetical protein ACOYOU_04360 [Kiritimatiellia bacterium]
MKNLVHAYVLLALCVSVAWQVARAAEAEVIDSIFDARAKAVDFDARAKAVDNKGAALLTEGMQQIVQYERLPTSDGIFGGYVRFLCALPPREEHLPQIILLLQKKDPYLQEAGVNLATASVKSLNNYSGLEDPLCALLKKPDLDGWVLYALVQFAKEAMNPNSPALTNFFGALAEATVGQLTPKTGKAGVAAADRPLVGIGMGRQMPINPEKDAKTILDWIVMYTEEQTPRVRAILPYLEKAYGTKGWKATRAAALKKSQPENK